MVALVDTILTDIDDTILRFGDGFQAWAEAKGLTAVARLRDSASIQECFNISRATTDDLVIEYSLSHSFRELEPEPCALVILPELHTMGYDFVAISSCVDGPVVTEHRIHNLEEVFGFEFKAIHLTGLLKPKVDFLKSYEASYWVEDNAGHAVVGAEMGHKTFLLDRTYNASLQHPLVTRVKDWHEIATVIHK